MITTDLTISNVGGKQNLDVWYKTSTDALTNITVPIGGFIILSLENKSFKSVLDYLKSRKIPLFSDSKIAGPTWGASTAIDLSNSNFSSYIGAIL